MNQFLDYIGNPISPGDIIVYPTAVGSLSADMNMARVEVIDPIVPDPSGNGRFCYDSMKFKPSHATVPFPTKLGARNSNGQYASVDAPERAYGLKVKKLYEGRWRYGRSGYDNPDRMFTLRNVDRVVVVTGFHKLDVGPVTAEDDR